MNIRHGEQRGAPHFKTAVLSGHHGKMQKRQKQTYDPRLRQLIHTTSDSRLAVRLKIPPSTVRGWKRTNHQTVVSNELFDLEKAQLQSEALMLKQRVHKLSAIIRLLVGDVACLRHSVR